MPHSGQKHDSACSHQAEKEDHDERMLVVHKIVAQAGATVGDAAICESEVDPSKCRGDMNEEETVEEANGCVSKSWQPPEKGYEGNKGHCDSEDDDGASDSHDGGRSDCNRCRMAE